MASGDDYEGRVMAGNRARLDELEGDANPDYSEPRRAGRNLAQRPTDGGEGKIRAQILGLNEHSATLHKLLEDLQRRIEPVLRPIDEGDDPGRALSDVATSEVSVDLDRAYQILIHLAERMQVLASRVEV